jgi:hypothetical protein
MDGKVQKWLRKRHWFRVTHAIYPVHEQHVILKELHSDSSQVTDYRKWYGSEFNHPLWFCTFHHLRWWSQVSILVQSGWQHSLEIRMNRHACDPETFIAILWKRGFSPMDCHRWWNMGVILLTCKQMSKYVTEIHTTA